MVKAVPSYRYKDKKWFYLLQEQISEGGDGWTWIAKRKETEVQDSGKSTVVRRRYFCIKQFPYQYRTRKPNEPIFDANGNLI
jgi:hypothetical protein